MAQGLGRVQWVLARGADGIRTGLEDNIRVSSSGKVRSDGSGQVESHLGRNRLTSDAPYKVGWTKAVT